MVDELTRSFTPGKNLRRARLIAATADLSALGLLIISNRLLLLRCRVYPIQLRSILRYGLRRSTERGQRSLFIPLLSCEYLLWSASATEGQAIEQVEEKQ